MGDGLRTTGNPISVGTECSQFRRRPSPVRRHRQLGRQAAIEAEQHFAQPIEIQGKRRGAIGIGKTERHRYGDLRLDFGSGAAGDRDKSSELACTKRTMALGDVGRDRDCGSSKLRDEPEFFFSRKRSGYAVSLDDDVHGELPDI
jgi:hypothetical protein